MSAAQVFHCRQCGDCCQGRGGIHVQPLEVAQMAAHLGLTKAEFRRRYLEASPLGERLATVAGACVFLQENRCLVHPVKPAICRHWPFLPALLAHPEELEGVKGACPGIAPTCSHADFVAAARAAGAWKERHGP